MKRKLLATITLIMCMVLMMSACGSGGSSSSAAPSEQASSTASVSTEASGDEPSGVAPEYEMPKFLTVGGSDSGGAYNSITTGIMNAVTDELGGKGFNATIMTTGGAAENCSLIQDGTTQMGMTTSTIGYYAYKGEGAFEKPLDKLCGVYNGLSEGVFHVITLENKNIKSIYDLKGKVVVLGSAGSATITMCKEIFPEYGFTLDDITPSYMSYTDASAALTDGKVDAVVLQGAAPAAQITDLTTTRKDIVLFGVDTDMRDTIMAKYPIYTSYTIPADMYKTSVPVETISVRNMMLCSADLDDGFVYDFCKATFTEASMKTILASHPSARNFTIDNAADCSIPLHPGAEMFYKEMGIIPIRK